MPTKQIAAEALLALHRRLSTLPPRSHERRLVMQDTARLYGVSEPTLYRALTARGRLKIVRRADRGTPRVLPQEQLERYCELIAAIKVRTSNKKQRHLSTGEAIRLLEEFGLETPEGFVQAPKGRLTRTTVNRYLQQWGFDRTRLLRQPAAVRFQAEHSNDCWQFDLSPSDLKAVKEPSWVRPEVGAPTLMLFSVVDDRSGVAYQEYHCVYGEDVEAALRFLFNAMAPKPMDDFPFHGIPQMLYLDNGPIAKSHVFQQVMRYLDVDVRTHMPQGKDGRRVTARSKGKVERPFRTVKEMHETLYHFHEPKDEAEANAWLMHFLVRYNGMQHRSEPHSRLDDWLQHLPPSGVRAIYSWERFCTFAREPERRKVGIDARVSVAGISYEVDPDLYGISLKRYQDAFAMYERALQLRPEFPAAWQGKGWVLHELGRDPEAQQAYTQAKHLRPGEPFPAIDLKEACCNLSNYFTTLPNPPFTLDNPVYHQYLHATPVFYLSCLNCYGRNLGHKIP